MAWHQMSVAMKSSSGAIIQRFAPVNPAEALGNRGNMDLPRYIATIYLFREAPASSASPTNEKIVADSQLTGRVYLSSVAIYEILSQIRGTLRQSSALARSVKRSLRRITG